MRRLVPTFLPAALVAFATTAFAGDKATTADTDKTGSPTVDANTQETNKKNLSYSDKSATAKGTNAPMNDKAAAASSGTVGANTSDPNALSHSDKSNTAKGSSATKVESATATGNGTTSATTGALDQPSAGESRKDLVDAQGNPVTKKKDKKDKVSAKKDPNAVASASSSTLPDPKPSVAADTPPLSATQGEKANSMTGKSAGQ